MLVVIWIAKIIGSMLRMLKFGGGTSLPGYLIEKYYPSFIKNKTKHYKKIILITGTNGKTTTQKVLNQILHSYNLSIVSNLSGANIYRGIVTTIINDCSIWGNPKSKYAVFEVEEATTPILCKYINADVIIVLNLFRDQLDAYGELFKTREYIIKAINRCQKSTVLLNADDPNVTKIADKVNNKCRYFKIDDKRKNDILYEGRPSSKINTDEYKIAKAHKITIDRDLSTRFTYKHDNIKIENLHFKSPGIQNIYNAIAAILAVEEILKIDKNKIKLAFSSINPAFGRGEIIKIKNKKIRLLLIKNPASFSINLKMLKNISALKLMILINDKIADGKDVSWLWDSDIEILKKYKISWITVSGTRAKDMALRLKYGGIRSINLEVEENIQKAIDISLSKLREGETLFILPTYTAMLEVRKIIGNIVNIKDFWK